MQENSIFCSYSGDPLVISILQSQVVGDPVRQNGGLRRLVLGGLRVFGVPSRPVSVWANGLRVLDFTYRTDTKVSRGPGRI